MNRHFMKTRFALAVATLLVLCVGCTNEELVSERVTKYEDHFKETFGHIDPTHDWSMATPVTANIDLSNAPEGSYEVKIYSLKNGCLLKKAIVQNAAQLHFDAIKGENSVHVLARNTSNLSLTAINGYFPIENGIVKTAVTIAQKGNTTKGSTAYKGVSLKTSVEEYEYVPEFTKDATSTAYAVQPVLSLPDNDGKCYIRILPDEDYSDGANGMYSVTQNGITTLMDMYQIYSVIRNHAIYENYYLLYKIQRTEINSNQHSSLWQEEWNDLEGTVERQVGDQVIYSREVDLYYIAWTSYWHPAYYKSDATETYNSWVVACEDLGDTYDYDFNDIVFDFGLVDITTTPIDATASTITDERAELYLYPLAAGGTKPAYIYYDRDGNKNYSDDELIGEIHDLLIKNAPTTVPISVGGSWDVAPAMITPIKLADVDMSQNTSMAYINQEVQKIKIFVDNDRNKGAIEVTAPTNGGSNIPQMLLLPRGWCWPKEMVSIFSVYPSFRDWTADQDKNGWITEPQGKYHENPLRTR